MRAEIDIRTDDGLRRARARLRAMRERSHNPIPAWNAVLDWFGEQERKQFHSEGLRWGERWQPLSPKTLRSKRRRGFPRNPLVRTHELRDQLTRRPFGVETLTPHWVTAGTNLSYAPYHQHGTDRMPRRKLVDARRVRAENVSGRAVINWVVHGEASTQRR